MAVTYYHDKLVHISSGGVRVGDQVRIAGIPVGKVTGVRLAGAVVEMKFDVMRAVDSQTSTRSPFDDARALTALHACAIARS